MATIERMITVSKGPFFFERDGVEMFQFHIDDSSIVGPYPAHDGNRAEHAGAYEHFKRERDAGRAVEPEFSSSADTRAAPVLKREDAGLSVFDMVNGVTEKRPPGAVQAGAGGRKAEVTPEPDVLPVDLVADAKAQKTAIRAELKVLGAKSPPGFATLEQLTAALAAAKS